MKKSHFLVEKGWDWGTPSPPHLDIVPSLSQVWPPFSRPFFRGSNKLLKWWDIAPPIYVLCVSLHLWTVPRQIKFWPILIKSFDWARPLSPSLGQNPKLGRNCFRTAPLIRPRFLIDPLTRKFRNLRNGIPDYWKKNKKITYLELGSTSKKNHK